MSKMRLVVPIFLLGTACATASGQIFVDAGADPNGRTDDGDTPLHFALSSKGLVELLLDRGADISARNQQGKTPLAIALENGHAEAAEALRAAGAIE